jgi:hypothetical protein
MMMFEPRTCACAVPGHARALALPPCVKVAPKPDASFSAGLSGCSTADRKNWEAWPKAVSAEFELGAKLAEVDDAIKQAARSGWRRSRPQDVRSSRPSSVPAINHRPDRHGACAKPRITEREPPHLLAGGIVREALNHSVLDFLSEATGKAQVSVAHTISD